ncbi:uncharacterized protein BO97DRAFT_60096 [Aspergillus homomorphus CBS 101889]|uniref:Uncharacterized protein n=1 Tax=Aspergillus homomorphus (strain CBS 101889) TaxID=1450537 RepID=A0A395HXB9_ASPHC|nr:hypothetical protein BO97DRAFT_60096 [Aspergillus homomorphus CBS 101889]RAL12139.1 hypothetical protein BO97DRAFT_60096 [Aspergillus homomorphus CBS 101889]
MCTSNLNESVGPLEGLPASFALLIWPCAGLCGWSVSVNSELPGVEVSDLDFEERLHPGKLRRMYVCMYVCMYVWLGKVSGGIVSSGIVYRIVSVWTSSWRDVGFRDGVCVWHSVWSRCFQGGTQGIIRRRM